MRVRDPAEIQGEIDRTREELAASIVLLRQDLAQAADWRTWVRRRPLAWVGAAFLAGFVLGTR